MGAPLCKSPEIISNGQNEENEEAPTLAKLQFFLRYVRPMIWHVLGLQPDSLVRFHICGHDVVCMQKRPAQDNGCWCSLWRPNEHGKLYISRQSFPTLQDSENGIAILIWVHLAAKTKSRSCLWLSVKLRENEENLSTTFKHPGFPAVGSLMLPVQI